MSQNKVIGGMEIPEGVINEEAFIKWHAIMNKPLMTTSKIQTTSEGKQIDIGMLKMHLVPRIQHLPEQEINKFLLLNKQYLKNLNTANAYKRMAFNITPGRGGTIETNTIFFSRKEEILELFGRMFTTEEVTKIVNEEWKMPVTYDTLNRFRKKNMVEIEKRIESFRATYSDIRLGIKRSRLEELTWLYHSIKDKFKSSGSREDYKLLLQTLTSIRQETHGDIVTLNGQVTLNYEQNLNQHMREEILKTMNIKEIILGRVASRMNIPGFVLINSLNNSYYAKFNNVVQDAEEVEYAPVFPSTQNYDFVKIKALNEEQEKKDQVSEMAVLNPDQMAENLSRAELIRQSLAKRIKEKVNNLDKKIASINNSTQELDKNKQKDNFNPVDHNKKETSYGTKLKQREADNKKKNKKK